MIIIKVKPIAFEEERIDTLTIDNEQELFDFQCVKYPRDDNGAQRRLLVEVDVKDLMTRSFICGSDSLGKAVFRHIEHVVMMHYAHNLVR